MYGNMTKIGVFSSYFPCLYYRSPIVTVWEIITIFDDFPSISFLRRGIQKNETSRQDEISEEIYDFSADFKAIASQKADVSSQFHAISFQKMLRFHEKWSQPYFCRQNLKIRLSQYLFLWWKMKWTKWKTENISFRGFFIFIKSWENRYFWRFLSISSCFNFTNRSENRRSLSYFRR